MAKKSAEYVPLRMSLEDFVALSARDIPAVPSGYQRESHVPGSGLPNDTYYGGISYAQALEMARHGWPEGRAAVSRISSEIAHKLGHAVKVPSLNYAVVGDMPDVGAFVSGVPEHMLAFEETAGAGRIIKLVVALGAPGSITAEEIRARGSVAVALVDALESAGIRCEIIGAKSTRMNAGTRWEGYITLKRPDEPLNIDRIAFALAHVGFFRRLIWNAYEITPDAPNLKMDRGGYGHTADVPDAERGDIYMPAITNQDGWRGLDAAGLRDRALALLRQAGVELEEGA